MIKSIIFDFDGVFADSYRAFFDILHEVDSEITEQEFRDRFNGNYYQHAKQGTSAMPSDFFEKFFERCKDLQLNESSIHALKYLSSRYTLLIVSSNIHRIIEHILSANYVSSCFSKIYSADTERSKVKKLQMIMEEYRLLASECIFITDTLGDILEAREVGIESLAYTGKEAYHKRSHLEQGHPLGFISSLSEVEEFLIK